MRYPEHRTHAESGNVMVYILIGIVLLAALNFAFSQGSDTGSDSTVDKGEAVIAASDIMRYAGTVQQTVRDLQQREGCSESDISFNFKSAYDHDSEPPDKCKIFNFQGGGMSYDAPQEEWTAVTDQDWYFTGQTKVVDIGTGKAELLMILPKLEAQICTQINNKLNVDSSNSPPEAGWGDDLTNFYTDSSGFNDTNTINNDMTGKRSGCFKNTGAGSSGNHYYQILIAR